MAEVFNMLEHVKKCLGQSGNEYVNDIFQGYIDEVREYLQDAGVPETVTGTKPCGGIVARGVADLWNYGAGNASLSPYFKERAAQLALKWGVLANG
jgi:hypothetical protein